jgi:chromosome segregation ATPase
MRTESLLRMAAIFSLASFTAFAAHAQQSSDPVADAARKARAEKQAAPKPKKVYTDDDLASTKKTPARPEPDAQSATSEQPAATTAADTLAAENDPKTEAYWRKRFRTVREKLDQSEKELNVLQRELNKAEVQYYPDPQKALMQQYDRKDINDKTAKIDAKKKQIDDLKQQLSDMEDDLRKAGGDPGWAR